MRTFYRPGACIIGVLAVMAAGRSADGLTEPASQAQTMAVPSIEGIWQGKLDIPGGALRVVFFVKKNADGSYGSTLDSPDQGAKGIAVAKTELAGRTFRVDIAVVGASFEGMVAEDGKSIAGTFKQGGASLPLTIVRTDKAPEVVIPKRPQTPKRPFPYAEREVSYENKAGGVKLAGTLTLPRTGGPFPAVLLITGSGPQDRDESLLGHRPFLILSDYLTRRGIAVLRVDDRGVGGSTGSTSRSTTEDFVGDVLAGVAFLKTQKGIDSRRVGLCGHSEGGVIGPMAAGRSKDVAFIVMMAGTGVPGDEIIYRQAYLIGKAQGATEAILKRQDENQRLAFAVVKKEKDPAEIKRILTALREKEIAKLPEDQRKAAVGQEAAFKASLASFESPWFRYFLSLDPRKALRKVGCPVLIVNGEKDLQVDPAQNVGEIRKALKQAGNRDVTVRILPGLNHLFQTCTTGSPTEYANIEETVSPVALKTIGDWIVSHTKPAASSSR